ncbi:MAG: outer membrane beta-barrel protein [Candidatus Aminicenantes bacterium]|nr:outer membrane beta-barrel protein [Candidatus Aminicenantes bacterium]
MELNLKKALVVILGIVILAGPGFSQVEFTVFGLYNLNISYPKEGDFNSSVESVVENWYSEWLAFFSTVLEQEDGLGFGARVAYDMTPSTGFEASIEYITAETAFIGNIVDNLQDKMESIGYGDWIQTANKSGGNIIRYYGNIVFNFPNAGKITPYATFGLGITQFKIQQNGPQIETEYGSIEEKIHLYYNDVFALTFNGGLGVKALFTPNIGLKLDARIFVCDPDFEQMFSLETMGTTVFDDKMSYIQGGTHIDANLNIGFIVRF